MTATAVTAIICASSLLAFHWFRSDEKANYEEKTKLLEARMSALEATVGQAGEFHSRIKALETREAFKR